jgi:hypothetical protein
MLFASAMRSPPHTPAHAHTHDRNALLNAQAYYEHEHEYGQEQEWRWQRENAIDARQCFCRNRGMMRTRIAVVIVTLSVIATGACFAANAQLGTWKLNEAKSKIDPATGGKNSTVTYAEEKGDKIKVTVDGVNKDGKPRHSVWVGKFDGKAYPMKGKNMPVDSIAYKMVNDRTNEITAIKNGKTMWSGTITVSKDGKSRTVDVHGTDENGKKFTSKAVYDKQ